MQEARANPAYHVKEEIGEVAKEVLDVIAEDPEEEHVSGEVQEAGMKKHTRDQRQERDVKGSASCKKSWETGGDRGVSEKQGVKRPAREGGFQTYLVEKDSDVGKDQRDIHEGIGARRIQVFEWDEHEVSPQQSSETCDK